jgi:hypothetical protein
VLPLTQVMVPPAAKAVAEMGLELPPVLPPVHPLTTMVLLAFPVMVVHAIDTAAPASELIATTEAPETGMANAATNSNSRNDAWDCLRFTLDWHKSGSVASTSRNLAGLAQLGVENLHVGTTLASAISDDTYWVAICR